MLARLPQQALARWQSILSRVDQVAQQVKQCRPGLSLDQPRPSAATRHCALVHLRRQPKMLWPWRFESFRQRCKECKSKHSNTQNTGRRCCHANVLVGAEHLQEAVSQCYAQRELSSLPPAEHMSAHLHWPPAYGFVAATRKQSISQAPARTAEITKACEKAVPYCISTPLCGFAILIRLAPATLSFRRVAATYRNALARLLDSNR